MKQYLFTIILTAAITFALSWAVWRLSLKFKLYPGIRERDVHKTPTPRLGGVAMFIGIASHPAMIVVVITEMISSVDGLGYLVSYSLSSLRTDRILALVVVIAALGLALDRLLLALRDRLVYWEKLDTYFA